MTKKTETPELDFLGDLTKMEVPLARAAFIQHRKKLHRDSRIHNSLAQDWTGRGFKDHHINECWNSFLRGWLAAKGLLA